MYELSDRLIDMSWITNRTCRMQKDNNIVKIIASVQDILDALSASLMIRDFRTHDDRSAIALGYVRNLNVVCCDYILR